MLSPTTLIRTTEWSSVSVSNLTIGQRRSLATAADICAATSGLPEAPIGFSGPDGALLTTNHYVGIISAAGVAVEILPKLDRGAVAAENAAQPTPETAMRHLIWMMQTAGHLDLAETGIGALHDKNLRYFDLFAWLLIVNLQRELALGVVHDYFAEVDDLTTVRGRIDFTRQATHNWNRVDRIACRWDEYSADTPMNRVFKAATQFMATQVVSERAAGGLVSLTATLADVSDVSPLEALSGATTIRWSRNAERYRSVFNFAVRLLRAIGHDPIEGGSPTFTWLVDMNAVFEDFVAAAVEAKFGVAVEKQKFVGKLLCQRRGGIRQYADTFWRDLNNVLWIGDAKYKQLSHTGWSDLNVSPADIRQLTTYGGLTGEDAACKLVLFYPTIGVIPPALISQTWNDLEFRVVPVSLIERPNVADALPARFGESAAIAEPAS